MPQFLYFWSNNTACDAHVSLIYNRALLVSCITLTFLQKQDGLSIAACNRIMSRMYDRIHILESGYHHKVRGERKERKSLHQMELSLIHTHKKTYL